MEEGVYVLPSYGGTSDRARPEERARLIGGSEDMEPSSTTMTMMMGGSPLTSEDESNGRRRRGGSLRWWLTPSEGAVRVAAASAVFALGCVAGSMNRAARDETALAEAQSRVLDAMRAAESAQPALGLSQYQRDQNRAKRAHQRSTRLAPTVPPNSFGDAMTGVFKSPQTAQTQYPVADGQKTEGGDVQSASAEYSASYEYDYSGEDAREIITGQATTLNSSRKRLVDANTEDENRLGYYKYPSVAKGRITFVSETNIWIANAGGGPASRLSASYSREGVPMLSPDGKHVAFLAMTYDGYDVFITPTMGGVTQQVTFGGMAEDVASWSEMNELLIVSSQHSQVGAPQLAKLDPWTRKVESLPFSRAIEGTKDGKGCYVFVPLRQTSETKRYEGGEQSRLWRWCEGDVEASQLTPEESWGKRGAWAPVASNDSALSDSIFFVSDREGVANVWHMRLTDGRATQLTFECVFDVKEISVDGSQLYYRRGGELFVRDIVTDSQSSGQISLSEPKALQFSLVSEFRKTAPTEIEDPYGSISEFVLANDGAFAAFVIRGQIFYSALVPFLGARVEKVSRYSGAVRYKHIQFVNDASADGQPKILALSDATGEYEYVLFERASDGGAWKETQITTGGKIRGAMEFSSISPDSTALVFADTNGNLQLVNLTNTAVNTNLYRTTEPEAVDLRLAKAKKGAKQQDTSASGLGAARRQRALIRLSSKTAGATRNSRRQQRRTERRRAERHLHIAGLKRAQKGAAGAKYASVTGLASMESLLNGFRPEGVYDLAWSPDSSYIAFSKDEENDFTSIHVFHLESGETSRITRPSYNAHSPKFSPDGLYLYYFSDEQIGSPASSPYGSRGAEPSISETSRLMCVPLRMGMTCPFFIGDELNAEGSVFDPQFGRALPTVISKAHIEERAQVVPELPDAQYLGFDIIADGSGILLTLVEDEEIIVAVYSMYTRTAVPLYANPLAVVVSGDLNILTLVTEDGVGLMSTKSLLEPGMDQERAIGSAEVWLPPDSFSVTIHPREEWLQMYEEAMRNMRDAFYDPNLHGVDWVSITDRYRALVYKISAKAELHDILGQAFGELSALHVFVSIASEDPILPLGAPSGCLGADFERVSNGLKIKKIHQSSGILAAPQSSMSQSTVTSHVNLIPGDVITKIDGVPTNSTSSLSELLIGKAGTQVLLEVIKAPRSRAEERDERDLQKLMELRMMQEMMSGGGAMPTAKLGEIRTSGTIPNKHVASLVRKHSMHPLQTKPEADTPSEDAHHREGHQRKLDLLVLGDGSANKNSADNEDKTNKPELVIVTPLSLTECDALRAADDVISKRKYIQEKTNGDVAYVYLEDMEQVGPGSSNSFDDFASQFYPNVRKRGLIIDVRRNAGGNIDTWILERLRRVAWMFDTERSGPGDTTMQSTFRGKVVVLIDEQTSSDAEMFALGIQQLKIGTVVGERTWGGAIGYSGHPELRLVDGSGFTIPSFGPYLDGDWAIEQKGVTPDVKVSNLPVNTFKGGDAQLDKAIELINDMIAKSDPVALPPPPKYPIRAFNAAQCSAAAAQPISDAF